MRISATTNNCSVWDIAQPGHLNKAQRSTHKRYRPSSLDPIRKSKPHSYPMYQCLFCLVFAYKKQYQAESNYARRTTGNVSTRTQSLTFRRRVFRLILELLGLWRTLENWSVNRDGGWGIRYDVPWRMYRNAQYIPTIKALGVKSVGFNALIPATPASAYHRDIPPSRLSAMGIFTIDH